MTINPENIKPGDTVRMRLQSHEMRRNGIDPVEFVSEVYAIGDQLQVAAMPLNAKGQVTILEHVPARPDWVDALVVRDKDGDLWMKGGDRRPGEQLWTLQNDHNTILATADLNDWAPITVVLDAEGNPPVDELPGGSVADRPDWADARVIRIECVLSDRLAIQMAGSGGKFHDDHGVLWSLEGLIQHEEQASITVVLDADGNPPTAEVEWLDADALDKLPVDSVALCRFHGARPQWKGLDGKWRPTVSSESSARCHTSRDIAPARVLWRPES